MTSTTHGDDLGANLLTVVDLNAMQGVKVEDGGLETPAVPLTIAPPR